MADIHKIEENIRTMPARKARAATEAEERRLDWQKHREKERMVEAGALLRIKAEKPELTVNELRAEVEIDEKVVEARMETIMVESEYRKKVIEMSRYDDEYMGAKKLAEIHLKERRGVNDNV